MKLEIVTPIRRLDAVEASEVVIPGANGEFGVLPGHKPYLAQLDTGVMTYREGGSQKALMLSGGLCEVLEDRITVLAEYVQPAEEIDRHEAQQKLQQFEKELSALAPGDDQTKPLSKKVKRWQARIATLNSKK